MQSGYDINQLMQEAQTRWLKPPEVLFILQNHEKYQITQEAPQKPPSGSLFLFNKRVLRFFRKDGHNWRKKKDGRTVGEAHERLKVGNAEALNCYYAHGEENPSFQRRSYWMLDPAYEHIVLVHYREIAEGRLNSGSIVEASPGTSSMVSQSPNAYTVQYSGSASLGDFHESYPNHSSPGSVEVNSDATLWRGIDYSSQSSGAEELRGPPDAEVSQALRRLEVQLSLDDDSLKEYAPLENQDGSRYEYRVSDNQPDSNYDGAAFNSNVLSSHQDTGGYEEHHHLTPGRAQRTENEEPLSWNNVLDFSSGSLSAQSKGEKSYKHNTNEYAVSYSWRQPEPEVCQSHCFGENTDKNSFQHGTGGFTGLYFPASSSQMYTSASELSTMLLDSSLRMSPVVTSTLTVAKEQRFTIREISPEWGFSSESTKVFIIGSFLCDPAGCAWHCMFGNSEVPLQFIQDGVLCCQAPPHPAGKVTLCITSGNRESCSEIRDFEYRDKDGPCERCDGHEGDSMRSTEELLLLVRFVQMLLSNTQEGEKNESGFDLRKQKTDDDLWGQIMDALFVGGGRSLGTLDWLLQRLLQDKVQQWLSSRSLKDGNEPCSLSRNEQGIIHMIAGLGYEWALNPILGCGVGINFRDINGWTALHWAARFGREKMVAALIASGASAVAVTDPSSQDPTGRTPAYIAEANGHKGLAAYLSEVALTSHLSSLTIEESELSKGSADVEAELAVNSISKENINSTEDQLSLKHPLAAVRNAAQAAARIQAAFRAHSFRKRQQREVSISTSSLDEYGFTPYDIQGISAASKLAFRNLYDHNKAALSIQKNYRGWKSRKDFLTLRQKVVKIQAHVRGYQVRKKYKVFCWAVGILDKAVLRWRRKGAGLRGYKPESECLEENEEDEDIAKVFREEKVNVAIDEAVSRVLSMVESPEARQQYNRVLGKYKEAKAELQGATSQGASSLQGGASNMDKDDILERLC